MTYVLTFGNGDQDLDYEEIVLLAPATFDPNWTIVLNGGDDSIHLDEPFGRFDGITFTVLGGNGNDSLQGSYGDDIIDGGSGDDWYQDLMGNDVYYIDSLGDFIVPGTNSAGERDTIRSTIDYALSDNMENLELMGSLDLIGYGNSQWNLIVGNSGANILDGLQGGDTLQGGAGDDVYVIDSTFDQVIELSGEGLDIVETGVSFTLSAFIEQGFLASAGRNQSLTGNTLGNLLVGNSGMNTLSGLDGKDELRGEGGSDTLLGGNGIDTLDGGTGADRMEGGAQNDIYYVDNGLDLVIELTDGGYDTVFTSTAIALPDHVEKLVFNGLADGTMLAGNDLSNFLVGNYTDDIIDLGAGSDSAAGGSGDDTVLGGGGNDTLLGEFGIDSLQGGLGRDILMGGAGADVFVFVAVTDSDSSARDLIRDFQAEFDTIDLRQIDALTTTGNQAFAFIGADSFSAAGQVRVTTTDTATRVEASIDADAEAELMILLSGVQDLTAASFLL